MAYDSVGFLVGDVARLLRRTFDARARTLGVTKPQWQVLFALSRNEGINQAGLADRLEIENITLCRMVDRLAGAGLVERRSDPADRRAWRLYLTDAARPLLDSMHSVAGTVEVEALAGLTPAEASELVRLLERVRANLSARSSQGMQAQSG